MRYHGSLLAAAVVATALTVSVPATDATANVVTCDNCALLTTQMQQYMSQIQEAGQQLQQLTQQYNEAVLQYQQLVNTYNTFTHITNLAGAVGALAQLGIQNPLPVNPWAVQQLFSGGSINGISGISPSINGLYNQNWSANHVYTPTGNTWYSQQLQINANGIAGIQSIAQRLYQSMAQRMPLMQQLESRLATASDPKTVMDLQARLQYEQSVIQSQQAQAQTLGTMASTQFQSEQQQLQEKRQQDIDAVMAADPD